MQSAGVALGIDIPERRVEREATREVVDVEQRAEVGWQAGRSLPLVSPVSSIRRRQTSRPKRRATIAHVRVLIVDTCYEGFLDAHHAERPELVDAPYDVQWRALMDRFFGTGDSYSHFLGELGHEAHEVVINCEPLQRAWAREHRVALPRLPRLPRGRPLVLAQADELARTSRTCRTSTR